MTKREKKPEAERNKSDATCAFFDSIFKKKQ